MRVISDSTPYYNSGIQRNESTKGHPIMRGFCCSGIKNIARELMFSATEDFHVRKYKSCCFKVTASLAIASAQSLILFAAAWHISKYSREMAFN